MEKFILKNFQKNLFKTRTLFNLAKRNKYIRHTQPGLTRYNYDQLNHIPEPYERSRQTHFSNAEELIYKVPPIEVDDDVAMCLGVGELGWGHPIEYISVNTRDLSQPQICKYCGLKYVKKQSHHH